MTAPRAQFVQVPIQVLDALSDGKISPTAFSLYVVLLKFINNKRGDADVWPSRKTLAAGLHMKVVRSVDRYLTELVDAGFVIKQSRRDGKVNLTNMYTLAVLAGGSAQLNTTPSARISTTPVLSSTPGVVLSSAPELEVLELEVKEPHESSSSPRMDRAVADVRNRLSLDDDDEALRIIENRKRTSKTPVNYVDRFIASIPDEDLRTAQEQIIADRTPSPSSQRPGTCTAEQRWNLEPCQHGNPGGAYINAKANVHWCPKCRTLAAEGGHVPPPKAVEAMYDPAQAAATPRPAPARSSRYSSYEPYRNPAPEDRDAYYDAWLPNA